MKNNEIFTEEWWKNELGLNEIKINNPILKSPIVIHSQEEWEKLANVLIKKGYEWMNGAKIFIENDPYVEKFPQKIYKSKIKPNSIGHSYDPNINKSDNFGIFENQQSNNLYDEFINFVESKLKLSDLKKYIKLTQNKQDTQTFAHFDPSTNEIVVYVKDRVNGDWMRSLAHECVHFLQNRDGVLTPESGKDGHEHENEANSKAGVIMREFGRKYPEIFTTKYEENL